MNLDGLKPGDIVQADAKGAPPFYALIEDVGPKDDVGGPTAREPVPLRKGEVLVRTIGNGRTVRIVKAREVVGKWRRRKS